MAKSAIPAPGEKAPQFKLPATTGENVSLKALTGRWVVLYFYPKDATPGCTQEGHDFSALIGKFRALNADVYGVSRDTMASHEKFKEKQKYKVDLISDSDEALCNALGVIKLKNMYGKKVRGIERSTFVIDPKGRIAKEWRKVKVDGHAKEVLEYIEEVASAD